MPADPPVQLVLDLAGTTVSLQQTMVVPLLPGLQHLLDVSADDIS